jgi:HemX protein
MIFPLSDRTWLWAAAALYLVGFVQATWVLLRGGKPSGTATYVFMAVGYVCQFIGLGIRGKAIGGSPLTNFFEVFQFTAWSAITLYLVIGVRFRNSLLGYFTSCLTAALTIVSLSQPAWDATHIPHVLGTSPWIELHATLALFSYGVFALLALTSLMFLLRNYSLKSKRVGGLFSFLPSILDLDHISVRLLIAGVVILTASLGVILAYYLRDLSTANVTKVVGTVAVWLAYIVALVLRLRGTLLAKRFAWTCVAVFIAALVTLGFVDASRHPIAPKTTTRALTRLSAANVAATGRADER